jgi:kinesin family protein 5
MTSIFNFSTPTIELTLILNFCTWEDRFNVGYLNKRWSSFTHSREYFKMMCNQLELESGVYISPVTQLPINETWEQLFYDLFKLRKMWFPREENIIIPSINNINGNNMNETESHWRNGNTSIGEVLPFESNIIRTPGTGSNNDGKYKITVFARFKPPTPSIEDIDSLEEQDKENNKNIKEVSLPLHQRLSMIKMSHKNIKTNRDALKVLASEGGWFSTKWNNIEQSQVGKGIFNNDLENNFIGKQNVPKIKKNIDKNANKIIAGVQSINPGTASVVMITPDVGLREFNFEGVLNQKTSQSKLYEESARRLICDFINGFNATILVYGQTGSGKTFSMFGPDDKAIYGNNITQRGIIPRTCAEILTAIEKRRNSFTIDSQMSVSYVEIFGDSIFDLLKNGEKCGHSKVSAQRYVLQGAAEQSIHDLNDISIALENGESQKRKAATAMNERSSRAHAVFIITLRQTCIKTGVERSSKLFLADLGGSENVKKSKVATGNSNTEGEFSIGFELGDRMREAVNINLGLLALKKCIECLNNGSSYIPFQDSKLTMLLSEGLGGNSKTSVIVCGSMVKYSYINFIFRYIIHY